MEGASMKSRKISNSKVYNCLQCSFSSIYKASYKRHCLTHMSEPKPIYKCSTCNFETRSKMVLMYHARVHRDITEKCFMCEYCLLTFESLDCFKEHMNFLCEFCPFRSCVKHSFDEHLNECNHQPASVENDQKLKIEHTTKKPEVTKYNCSKCSFSSKHKTSFTRHNRVHMKKSTFKCSTCDFETKSKLDLMLHARVHREGKCYMCEYCLGCFESLNHFKEHMNFRCESCPFRSCVKCKLEKHIKESNHHPASFKVTELNISTSKELSEDINAKETTSVNDILKCTECDFKALSKGSLKLHKLLHECKMLSCPLCDFSSHIRKLLEIHLEIHGISTQNGEFKCRLCAFSSCKLLKMNAHVKRHERYERHAFPCSQCDLNYKTRRGLKSHELTHSTKEFSCTSCNFKSSDFKLQVEHMKIHKLDWAKAMETDAGLYQCIACNFVGRSKPALHIHLAKMHKNRGKRIRMQKNTLKNNRNVNTSGVTRRNYTHWTYEEKKEIYWCHIYSRHSVFAEELRLGRTERRRNMLYKRGIINKGKLAATPESRLHSMAANIGIGRTRITKEGIAQIERSVNEFVCSKNAGDH